MSCGPEPNLAGFDGLFAKVIERESPSLHRRIRWISVTIGQSENHSIYIVTIPIPINEIFSEMVCDGVRMYWLGSSSLGNRLVGTRSVNVKGRKVYAPAYTGFFAAFEESMGASSIDFQGQVGVVATVYVVCRC